jgi:hypothetical protein
MTSSEFGNSRDIQNSDKSSRNSSANKEEDIVPQTAQIIVRKKAPQ